MAPLVLSLLSACSDYTLEKELPDPPEGWPPAIQPPSASRVDPAPRIEVWPSYHDFGVGQPFERVTQSITVENAGLEPLTVSGLTYDSGPELVFSLNEADNGSLPWTLGPGERRVVEVAYTPIDEGADQGTLVVASDDPERPRVDATQVGAARFDGFTTGWYIVDDDTPYDLTSDPAHRVDYDGDPDAYWYEPSGVHGMTDSTDVPSDFALLRQYVLDRAGGPTAVTGPLSFYAESDLPDMQEGSFSYILCDFWMPADDDPSRYTISTGRVDDGIRVLVNGTIVGELTYNQSGSWTLSDAVSGQLNTLVVILVDNAMWEKYVYDLGFYRDGVFVEG